MVYDLSDTEKRTLASGKDLSDNEKQPLNKSEVYSMIRQKMVNSVDKLSTFTANLDNMDDKNFSWAKNIKDLVIESRYFLAPIRHIMTSTSISERTKKEFAAAMFHLSIEHMISRSDDEIFNMLVKEPLEFATANLSKLTRSNYYQKPENLAELSENLDKVLKI